MSARIAAPRGLAVRVLENAHLRAELVPAAGGKFISLINKSTGTEWFLPPLRPYAEARADGGFEQWDGGGFDECLPTVAAAGNALDHGELWRHAWREEPSQDGICLRTTALGGALSVTRLARLDGPALILDYKISNAGGAPVTLIYSAHPLLRVEPGDRILLPPEVTSVAVEGSLPGGLEPASRAAWPVTASGQDLSRVGPPDGRQADKFYAGPLRHGWCALVRPGEGIGLHFNAAVLPYLGLWICRAAWPSTGAAKQYTVAFEPASAPADSVAEATHAGSAWTLAPGERRAWTLRFRVGTQTEIETGKNQESPQ